jgi:hypothetical protein
MGGAGVCVGAVRVGGWAGFVEAVAQPVVFEVDVVAGPESLALSWDAVDGAQRYNVYCGLSDDALLPVSGPLETTAFEIDGLTADLVYWVQVVAELGPRRSIASSAVSAYLCTPLEQSACYLVIQTGNEVLDDRTVSPDGGGFGTPYHYTANLDWNDGSCGVQLELQNSFGSVFVVIDHANIPLHQQDMRRVVLDLRSDGQAVVVVQSNPAALSGDPVFSQQLPNGDPFSVVIDFTTDCVGNLATAVATLIDRGV